MKLRKGLRNKGENIYDKVRFLRNERNRINWIGDRDWLLIGGNEDKNKVVVVEFVYLGMFK